MGCLLAVSAGALDVFGAESAGKCDTLRTVGASGVVHYVYVYLPPNYRQGEAYPVLYLMHGFMGNQYSWEVKGQISHQLDSLIGNKIIRPLVVAMPYCIPKDTTQAIRQRSVFYNILHYTQLKKGDFERTFPDITEVVRSRYRVDSTCQAVAGLSYGARVAANVAKTDTYQYVGLFTPVLGRKQLPEAKSQAHYWVSVGRKDFFFRRKGDRLYKRLVERQVPCSYHEVNAGHNWRNWRVTLGVFLRQWLPYQP